MSEPTTPTQEVRQPAEAGFSTNLFLNHPKMGRVQFTFRGATSADWGVVLEDVDRFMRYMRDKGWIFDGENKPPEPTNTIPVIDELGAPVVNADGKPEMTKLPDGVRLYTVASLVHDKNKDGTKDILKVFTVEPPYNKGYGVACFHPPAALKGFVNWPVTSKEAKNTQSPPEGCRHVIIRDPGENGKYPSVIEFRP
jgi:hypothetical protein